MKKILCLLLALSMLTSLAMMLFSCGMSLRKKHRKN